jgi:hypothetical protein
VNADLTLCGQEAAMPSQRDAYEDAQDIAACDPRIEQLLDRPGVRVRPYAPRPHRLGHRVVGLIYLAAETDGGAVLAYAVVDLTVGEVAAFRRNR